MMSFDNETDGLKSSNLFSLSFLVMTFQNDEQEGIKMVNQNVKIIKNKEHEMKVWKIKEKKWNKGKGGVISEERQEVKCYF